MKEYVPVVKDCEHCSRKKGSFGCCSTVNNNWVYSCAEGQKEWALDKIRAEIEQMHLIGYAIVDGKREIARRAVMQIIDKYRA